MAANDIQVGGEHYRQPEGVPQHWDLALMYDWDPFQYQITKYIMRWKTKHPTLEKQIEDLKKARHFLDKYIEHYEGVLKRQPVRVPAVIPAWHTDTTFSCEGYYGDGVNQLYKCKGCGAEVKAVNLNQAHATVVHAHDCPTPGRG